MFFNDFAFLYFFLIVYGVSSALLRAPTLRKGWLLVASYAFYMCWSQTLVLLLLGSSLLDFWVGGQLARSASAGRRKGLLVLSLLGNLGLLASPRL